MKLAIMQPYFFPYLGYFQLIHAADRFILYDNLNYIKGGWINRNRFLLVNGKPMFFTIPVKAQSSYSKIRDIRVDGTAWRRTLLKQIQRNYQRSPYFEEVFPLFENVIQTETDHLAVICALSIQKVCAFLNMPTEVVSDIEKYASLERHLAAEDSELRRFYREKLQLDEDKTIRIFHICREERADAYVNAIGGQALYDKALFDRNGIKLNFIHTLPYAYPQSSTEFFPNLSIIDILMNCGREDTCALLGQYKLI